MTPFNVTRLAYGDEPLLFGDLYMPAGAGPYPIVILIHGGFWRAAYGLLLMTGLAEDLAQRGIAASAILAAAGPEPCWTLRAPSTT